MGAEPFVQYADGKNMSEAFDAAHKQALWDHGHSGYSGSIAEKPGFVDCGPVPDGDLWDLEDNKDLPEATVNALTNKWDECAGFVVEPGKKYVFVGWASS